MDKYECKSKHQCECERACRISLTTNDIHDRTTNIYESLVDRDFETVKSEVKLIKNELSIILKSLDDDEF